MPEKEQRKERKREEKTGHRIRKLLEERWRGTGRPRTSRCNRLYLVCHSLGEVESGGEGQRPLEPRKKGTSRFSSPAN